MRSTLCFLVLLVCASVNAQTTVITEGEIRLGLEVYDHENERYIDISKISSGFDEDGLPIDLILPINTQIRLWLPDVDQSNADQFRIIDENKIKNIENFNKDFEDRMVAFIGSISYGPGSYDAIRIVKLSTRRQVLDPQNVRLELEWRTDVANIELEIFIQNDQIDERQNYTDSLMNNLFSSNQVTKGYDYWLDNGYSEYLNEEGLPENPVIPIGSGMISFETNAPDVTLTKDGVPVNFYRFESRNYSDRTVFFFKPENSGAYLLRMNDPRKVYGQTAQTYSFSVPFNFWKEGGYFMLGSIGLLGVIFLIYRVNAKRKLESAELNTQVSQAELKAIRSQLNPHFLFNALSAIQNLVNQKDNEQANNYIVKLSRLMRQVLAESSEAYHTLEDELTVSKNYIELEQLRKPFQFEIDIDGSIEMNTLVPNMLLQPYLENAVIHGVNNNGANLVSLKIQEKNGGLVFKITNDGKQAQSSVQEGQGMKLGQQRLEIINKQYGDGSATVKTHVGIEQFTVEIKLPKDL